MGAGVRENLVGARGSGLGARTEFAGSRRSQASIKLTLSMAARFYAPDLNPSQQVARLPADEAHHLVKVLRLGPGAIVGVFDGRGNEWRARVETAGRDGVEVSLLEPVPARRPTVDHHAGSGRAQGRHDGRRRPRLHDGWRRRDSARSHSADYRQDVRRDARPGPMAARRARFSQAMRRRQAAGDRKRPSLRRLARFRAVSIPNHAGRAIDGRRGHHSSRVGVAADTKQSNVDGRT